MLIFHKKLMSKLNRLAMIELRKVSKIFSIKGKSNTVIDKLSLTIDSGDIHGIIGQSGAGKSTLLRLINFLERPDFGDVYIDGKNLLSLTRKQLQKTRQNIGIIFQQFNLIKNKCVYENI